MKIAISASGDKLDAPIDPRFGRSPYHVIVDTDTMSYEAVANTGMNASSGAGIGAAQSVASKGVQAVVTGSFGPNATMVLSQAGIKMMTGATGTVREAVEAYRNSSLTEVNPTPGTAYGRGMGRGMGNRSGRGMGRGGGYQRDSPLSPPETLPQKERPDEERYLKERIDQLEKQMNDLKKKLSDVK